ncbi:hypothetical protein PVAND_003215 [Polypedilum vanderplanki]|uniref:Uncharacterized protein n=1 Tax=Polypedilum vanderplanki TaxID=319348 RepID=A0A9J6BTV4_POLVA|nr:hypothetical protein PVAND_003215 [Polypedilum vanderplanki]
MGFLLSLLYLIVFFICFLFYFFRSTNTIPKNWRELKSEVLTIVEGMMSQNQDFILRKRNRIKLMSLNGRVAVITGGNRGIGLFVVKKLLQCDIKIVMGVRNPEGAKQAVESIIDKSLYEGKINYEHCDTGDMNSVRKFAERVQQLHPAVHILINNAAVMATPYQETKDGFESQMAINYTGHFLLTHLLLPQLIAGSKTNDGKNVRIINVSSCAHRTTDIDFDDFHCKKFYYPADAYAKSKLAQVYFTKYLETIFKERDLKIQSHAPHPGIVNTGLFEHSTINFIPWFKDLFYKTPEQGSRTIIYAAISPYLEGKGGTYLSNCYFDKSHSKAKNFAETKRLFDYTCQLLNIKTFGVI